MDRFFNTATNLFPVWTVAGAVAALFWPEIFTWFKGDLIVLGLAVIMLGMGITLNFDDFKTVAKSPRPVLMGVGLQFLIMPFLGWGIATLMNLPPEFAVGLILVSCCPGGTASNVVTYLARAHLPLSVLMTMASTFAAILMTPILTKALAGKIVPVDALGLFLSTLKIVLLPVGGGILLNQYAPKLVSRVRIVSPFIAVVAIVLIVASIIGQRADEILKSGGVLLVAVTIMHGLAFSFGYFAAWFFGYEEAIRRTVAIEVGMQNSGLGSALATRHFSPSAATPCAISAVMHCIIGSALAGYWRWRSSREALNEKPPTSIETTDG